MLTPYHSLIILSFFHSRNSLKELSLSHSRDSLFFSLFSKESYHSLTILSLHSRNSVKSLKGLTLFFFVAYSPYHSLTILSLHSRNFFFLSLSLKDKESYHSLTIETTLFTQRTLCSFSKESYHSLNIITFFSLKGLTLPSF